ncbi:heavy metal-binding domain-containing protein [Mucilaginibacter sp. UYCu711]|uniref:heavy metal-binding domain-containing protein n=1 Tax=Mucilaginibacter sp. UYCu711 TaxID=3156339 RepID=UPI003D246F2C
MRSALIALAFISLSLGACSNSTKDKAVKKKEYKYYCVMHPEIGSDKPGVCSKCGMQMVERDADK